MNTKKQYQAPAMHITTVQCSGALLAGSVSIDHNEGQVSTGDQLSKENDESWSIWGK